MSRPCRKRQDALLQGMEHALKGSMGSAQGSALLAAGTAPRLQLPSSPAKAAGLDDLLGG